MDDIQRNIRDLEEGLTSLAYNTPRQVIRTLKMPTVKYAIMDGALKRIGLGSMDPLTQPYYTPWYFGNPQLFKMPRKFRMPGPALTPSVTAKGKHSLGAVFEQDTLKKALPFIAVSIAGIVAFNVFGPMLKKGKR